MKQQTAIEWLNKELKKLGSHSHLWVDWLTFDNLCKQAEEIENENLSKAYNEGCELGASCNINYSKKLTP